ncbi:MAG: hypothetical protein WC455_07240 [Dehalococcoidia bacterium]|jgi:hypothetical protein
MLLEDESKIVADTARTNGEEPLKHISFLCEHSAEYVLVHNIVEILSHEYDCIIPIFFWTTREGTSIASKGMGCNSVKLVTAYARRPKVQYPFDTAIQMKVNALLFHAAESGLSVGSPVLAGVPLANNLLQFTMSTQCSWFQLHKPANDARDVEIRLALDGSCVDHDYDCSAVEGPLTIDEILYTVRNNARLMSWKEAVYGMRYIRTQEDNEQLWFLRSGYRPFYLVIPS